MAKKRQILNLVNRFINYIDKLSDEEVNLLESNEANIKFEFVHKSKSLKTPNDKGLKEEVFVSTDIDTIVNNLHSLNNRKEVEDYLNTTCPNRSHLEVLAKKLDIPFLRKDKTEHLRNKIIEGTVGYKLRSQAIQTSGNTH